MVVEWSLSGRCRLKDFATAADEFCYSVPKEVFRGVMLLAVRSYLVQDSVWLPHVPYSLESTVRIYTSLAALLRTNFNR
jgi:hypothetical protein